jgi:hypothetical protein
MGPNSERGGMKGVLWLLGAPSPEHEPPLEGREPRKSVRSN